MSPKFPLFGILLILVGSVLLLDRTGVISLGWHAVFWGLVMLLGAYKITWGFSNPAHEGIFWGTIFFCVGGYNFLNELDLLEFSPSMLMPLLVLVIGTGIFLNYLRHLQDWHLLVPALFFMGLGTAMILSELGTVGRWEVLGVVKTYWPVALVFFGTALLLNRKSAQR
jgi:LiaF transmembrane domain